MIDTPLLMLSGFNGLRLVDGSTSFLFVANASSSAPLCRRFNRYDFKIEEASGNERDRMDRVVWTPTRALHPSSCVVRIFSSASCCRFPALSRELRRASGNLVNFDAARNACLVGAYSLQKIQVRAYCMLANAPAAAP
jgi:hypothetical protein